MLVTISIFSACGTGGYSGQDATTIKTTSGPGNKWGSFSWEIAKGVDQTLFAPTNIEYPARGFLDGSPISYLDSVAVGVATGIDLIESCPSGGYFVLLGYSQGAQVVSEILRELQPGGAIEEYMPQLLAGVTLGNPMREAGHSFPNDPTGCTGTGINSQNLLAGTPDLWWDMTNTYDLAGNIPTGGAGTAINEMWQAAGGLQVVSVEQLLAGFSNAANGIPDQLGDLIKFGIDLVEALPFLTKAALRATTLGHTCFGSAKVGNTGLTFVQYAIQYLNSLGTAFTP